MGRGEPTKRLQNFRALKALTNSHSLHIVCLRWIDIYSKVGQLRFLYYASMCSPIL